MGLNTSTDFPRLAELLNPEAVHQSSRIDLKTEIRLDRRTLLATNVVTSAQSPRSIIRPRVKPVPVSWRKSIIRAIAMTGERRIGRSPIVLETSVRHSVTREPPIALPLPSCGSGLVVGQFRQVVLHEPERQLLIGSYQPHLLT